MSTKKTGVDQQLIRDLAGILDETNLTEIEVEQGDLRIRVSRQSPMVHAAVAGPAPVASNSPIPVAQVDLPASAARRHLQERRHLADGRHCLYVARRRTPSPSSRSASRCARARRC